MAIVIPYTHHSLSEMFYILQPGGGLRREKTVVEQAAEMDDSEKNEIVGVLMREQTSFAMRLNREQTRQEEMVRYFLIFIISQANCLVFFHA